MEDLNNDQKFNISFISYFYYFITCLRSVSSHQLPIKQVENFRYIIPGLYTSYKYSHIRLQKIREKRKMDHKVHGKEIRTSLLY